MAPLPFPDSQGRPWPGLLCLGVDLRRDAEGWREAALPWVTATERARAQRFLHSMDGTRHLVGRALVRSTLRQITGRALPLEDFQANPWGKPLWPRSGYDFNISHSGGTLWVAVCGSGAVGIDVEAPAAALDPQALAAFLHPGEKRELARLQGSPAQAAFLRCWTRKEAVLKALGEGLSRPLPSFRVHIDERDTDWIAEPRDAIGSAWTTADLAPIDGSSVSVAAPVSGLHIFRQILERFP